MTAWSGLFRYILQQCCRATAWQAWMVLPERQGQMSCSAAEGPTLEARQRHDAASAAHPAPRQALQALLAQPARPARCTGAWDTAAAAAGRQVAGARYNNGGATRYTRRQLWRRTGDRVQQIWRKRSELSKCYIPVTFVFWQVVHSLSARGRRAKTDSLTPGNRWNGGACFLLFPVSHKPCCLSSWDELEISLLPKE